MLLLAKRGPLRGIVDFHCRPVLVFGLVLTFTVTIALPITVAVTVAVTVAD